ncbi:DUF4153 domain-containing protein [Streptomyces sp. NBC_00878]|uniref:DUF4153 domain-containing protein n=1 Tax=Streptomyces sp. NBC_00878 TaxID=2975854 RepID=UPI00225789F3|nr:DUF4173 domain-containing protein [Streptomyces sp. NBC_00878]MCX4904920.1 DUF4173 domain-containing protein [Streptomyces sp. NBC_00878]
MSDTPSEAEQREGPEDAVPAARTGDASLKDDSAPGDSTRGDSGGKRGSDAHDVDEGEGRGGPLVESWFDGVQAAPPAPVRTATLWSALATGVVSMLLLGDGLALNLLLVAIPVALCAYFAAQAAGRRPNRWTLVWGIGGLALLTVPALRDADWPSFLAVVAAVAVGSLALHGGRTWTGVLFGPIGLYTSLVTGPLWGWQGLRKRTGGARGNLGPVLRALAVAAVLVVVFGTLFAGADAAFADLLGGLVPDASVSGGPWHAVLFVIGLVGALVAAHTAAAPVQWDLVEVPEGRARGRVEWALPLIVLALLFAAFNSVQLAVLFGGYDAVLEKTGQTYAEYARQGFWQLLLVTLLTLLVIVFALRWAPRDDARDRTLVRAVLGTLCALALVVVAAAVRRMDMYVEAYGLTRLRISVVTVELWLGLVLVLIMAAGVWGARWLPRAVLAAAAAGVLAFGLVSPDGLIAERNVQRYEEKGTFDLDYARGLSADAVPALDALKEPLRSCALRSIARDLEGEGEPWYATSLGEARARDILDGRPLSPDADWSVCSRLGTELAYR